MPETNETAKPTERASTGTGGGSRRLLLVLRRLAAACVDAATVAVPTVLVAATLAERFVIVSESGARQTFSPADQLRIDEIDEGFNRAARIGDTLFTLSGVRWWMAVAALLAFTCVVFVVIPGRNRGRTLGKQLFGIKGSTQSTDDGPELLPLDELLTELGVSTAPSGYGDDPDDDELAASADTTTTATGNSVETVDGGLEPGATLDVPDVLSGMRSEASTPESVADHLTPDADAEAGDDVSLDGALGHPDEYQAWARTEPMVGDDDLLTPTAAAGSDFVDYADLALPESSLSESPLNTSVAVRDDDSAQSADEPEWSDLWQAWTYQDPASERWFRHDTEQDRWVPIG